MTRPRYFVGRRFSARAKRAFGGGGDLRGAAAAAAVVAWAMAVLSPNRAFAQVFEKFDESARATVPATPFLAGAYAVIWVAILTYVFMVARGLRRTENEVQELKRRIDARIAPNQPPSATHPSPRL